MTDILLVFASTHGHTGRIAERLAQVIRDEGASAVVADVRSAGEVDVAHFDGVVLGGSIHVGRHQRELVDWISRRAAALDARPSALFTVCLSAADDTDEARRETRRYHDELLAGTGWTPDVATTFAGALQYREYEFATRLVVRLIARAKGLPTDASHDHDYTDWAAVDAFGRECARMITGAHASA